MGIIIKQSFWGMLIIYGGVLLGYISTLIVFPAYLNIDQIGLIRLTQSNGLMLAPLAVIGMPGTWIQVFPIFERSLKEKSTGFSLILIIGIISNLVLLAMVFFSMDYIKHYFEAKSALYNQYIGISILIFISQSFFDIFTAFSQTNLNSVTPTYFKEVHLRAVNLLFVILFGIGVFDINILMYLIGLGYILTTLVFCILISIRQKFTPLIPRKLINKEAILSILKYAGYFTTIGVGGSAMLYTGQLITAKQLGLEANGILTTCMLIAVVVEMPRRALLQAITPLVSKCLNSNAIDELQAIHKRASLNLLIIGLLIFLGIVFNLNDLFLAIPKGESFMTGYWVVILAGAEKVVTMSFGLTSEVFTYSKLKRWNIILLVISSIFIVLLSAILIPFFGILGAAIALVAVQLMNQIVKALWIKNVLRIAPFSLVQFKLIFPIVLSSAAAIMVPLHFNPYLNILFKSIMIVGIFGYVTVMMKVSPEINSIFGRVLKLKP